jgi:hypothetical protein
MIIFDIRNVSEAGYISFFRCKRQKDLTQLDPLEEASLSHWTCLSNVTQLNKNLLSLTPDDGNIYSFRNILYLKCTTDKEMSKVILV